MHSNFILILVTWSVCAVQWSSSQSDCEEGEYCESALGLGCFQQGVASGYCHQKVVPRAITGEIQITVYTNNENNEEQTIQVNDKQALLDSVKSLKLSRNVPLWLIINHYVGQSEGWATTMAGAVTQRLNAAVIIVNWRVGDAGAGADPKFKHQTASNTRVTGALIAAVLKEISQSFQIQPSQMTVVGFSIAAHAAGHAGEGYPGLGRIIGLDPAQDPFYGAGLSDTYPSKSRLDESDANYVVVLRTDSNKQNFVRPYHRVGHVDNYVNGGEDQPGCTNVGGCDHQRSIHLLIGMLVYPHNCIRVTDCDSIDDWQRNKCWAPTMSTRNENGCFNRLDDILFSSVPASAKCRRRDVFFRTINVSPKDISFAVPTNFCAIEYRVHIALADLSSDTVSLSVDSEDDLKQNNANFFEKTFTKTTRKAEFELFGVTEVNTPKRLVLQLRDARRFVTGKVELIELEFSNGMRCESRNIYITDGSVKIEC